MDQQTLSAVLLALPEILQKSKGAVKMCMTVLKMLLLVNRNVTKMSANCGSRNACCFVYKVEIISLAFKRLIVLR